MEGLIFGILRYFPCHVHPECLFHSFQFAQIVKKKKKKKISRARKKYTKMTISNHQVVLVYSPTSLNG